MTFDISTLEPSIREILSGPGVDLSTVSAKGVRKQLIASYPELTPDFVKENKKEIDSVITRVYEQQVNSENGGRQGSVDSEATDSRKRKQGSEETDDLAEDNYEDVEDEEPKPKKSKKASKAELSDAQLARQLQNEINGRPTRAGNKRTNGGAKRGARAKKSSATIDSDDDSDVENGEKPKKKRSGGGGAKGGFAKEFTLSDPLAAVLNVEKLSRPQVVKQLWDYIKGNELQNPANKREIVCDDRLRAVFGVDKIDMFKMNKVLGQHLISEAELKNEDP